MKRKTVILFALFTFLQIELYAQNEYNIVFPTLAERDQQCNQFFRALNGKPKEVQFSIKRQQNNLFFETNDKNWFNQLFRNANDGIAVDVVSKKRYNCDVESIERSQIKGTLLRPIYTAQLKRTIKPSGNNQFRVLVGKIPEKLLGEELEYNILFLSNNTLCSYYTIYNLESYNWDLLDMGAYLDSLTFRPKEITTAKEQFVMKYKTLQFSIPFEKDKSEYKPDDLKPMYDSLRLTDYNIKKININAYASVEGSIARNLELQEQRATSIAQSLQSFQKPAIVTEIATSENWVEFLNDITNTEYDHLKSLSKTAVKEKLVGAFEKEMEPILSNHRKAVITLELDRKDRYVDLSQKQLVDLFQKSVQEENLEKALEIQNSIFEKIKKNIVLPDALAQMSVPRQKKYLQILIKNSMFQYLLDQRKLLIVSNELEKLSKLDPFNKRIKYNLAVLKFIIWRHNAQPVDEANFKNEILKLKRYGITPVPINRMLVNFHIVKAEKSMRNRDYSSKDKSVEYIVNNYMKFPFSNYDYLSLAQFLVYYSHLDKAVELLDEKVKSISVDEDLLFYYLNLTIVKKELTKTQEYRTIMLNAINMNKARFCHLFSAVNGSAGGVTFQLLEDEYLKNTYCENCNDMVE